MMNTDQWVSRVNALGREIDEYANSIAPSAWAGDIYLQAKIEEFRTLAAHESRGDTHQIELPGISIVHDNERCWHCGVLRPTRRKDQTLAIAEVEIGWRRSNGGDLGWGVNDRVCPDCEPFVGSSIERGDKTW